MQFQFSNNLLRFWPITLAFLVIWLSACNNPTQQTEERQEATIDSIALFTKRIMKDSSNASLFASRSKIYLKNGNLDPALRDMNRALTLSPDKPGLYLTLSDIYLVLGQTENSLASLKKAIRLNPELVAPYLKLAEVYLMVNDPKSANSAVDQAIEIDRNNSESFYIKGISLLQAGDTTNARLNLLISTRLDTINFMSYMQLAAVAVAQKDTLSATYLKEALSCQPHDERALFFLGMVEQEQGQYESALENFKQVTEWYPLNKRAFYHAGYLCLVELSDYASAQKYFQEAVDLDSKYVEAVYNLGRTYEAMEDYNNARKYYRTSLELLPNYPLAIQGLNRLDDNGLGL